MEVFNSDMEFKNITWQETTDEIQFQSMLAVPGYSNANNPYCIAVTGDYRKIVMVNTITRTILDIVVFKQNHPEDLIHHDSIILSSKEEESKTESGKSITVHFTT